MGYTAGAMATVLHILAQRPGLTGSGTTLDALVRCAADAGWEQWAVVGSPASDPQPEVAALPAGRVLPLLFGPGGALSFALPGMSDVMPYPSTRYSALTPTQLEAYLEAWRGHLRHALALSRPDVIHSHHLWLVSALLKKLAPEVPVIAHCHATGLRQRSLCPQLTPLVARGICRVDAVAALHSEHASAVADAYAFPPERITIVGAGYQEATFHLDPLVARAPQRLLYVGKLSAAKGLGPLLDAFAFLRKARPGVELHIAGQGAGDEAQAFANRIEAQPAVHYHGQLAAAELAVLMRRSALCVLPSFFEGVPLVLVEALACGCRIVATALPGVREQLAPAFGSALLQVALPLMEGVDRPCAQALPDFIRQLETALATALDFGPLPTAEPSFAAALEPFHWSAVFSRVEAMWRDAMEHR